MNHFTLPGFWKRYHELPKIIQELADRNFKLLKSNPTHPSLHFKKLGKNKTLWSVRVGISHRALGLDKPEGVVWFWIGSHAEYDKLLSKL